MECLQYLECLTMCSHSTAQHGNLIAGKMDSQDEFGIVTIRSRIPSTLHMCFWKIATFRFALVILGTGDWLSTQPNGLKSSNRIKMVQIAIVIWEGVRGSGSGFWSKISQICSDFILFAVSYVNYTSISSNSTLTYFQNELATVMKTYMTGDRHEIGNVYGKATLLTTELKNTCRPRRNNFSLLPNIFLKNITNNRGTWGIYGNGNVSSCLSLMRNNIFAVQKRRLFSRSGRELKRKKMRMRN